MKSNRVQEDIMRGKLRQGTDNYAPTIVIRKWMNIDPDLEFRTFVVQVLINHNNNNHYNIVIIIIVIIIIIIILRNIIIIIIIINYLLI
jgi:hypothetical protein